LELAHQIDTVIFDKTGTLTKGVPELTNIISVAGRSEDELLALAASLERGSEHSLAEAIVKAAEAKNLTLVKAEKFNAIPGYGVDDYVIVCTKL